MADHEQTKSDSDNPDQRDRNALGSHLWWVVFWSAVGLIVLIFVSVNLPYLQERAKFFTENALSFSILIAVIVQAVISSSQWRAMSDGLERTDKVIKQMEGQLEAMRDQGNLIRQQYELAVASERAYLRLRDWKTPRFEDGFLILEARIMNGGRTPAWEVQGHTRVGVDYAPLPPFPLIPSKEEEARLDAQPFLAIGASDNAQLPLTPLKVTDEQIRLVKAGKMKIFVDGVSRYIDSLGGRQFYTYGFTVELPPDGVHPRYERHHRVKVD